MFGFNSGRYDLNLIKSFLIPYLIFDKEIEPTVIEKANDFISFKFGDVQFLDIMKFHGGAKTLNSFLKAYKASEIKSFSPYEWVDSSDKLDCTELPPYEAFFSKLRYHNPLEKDFNDYQKLVSGGVDQQSALEKIRIQSLPPTDFEDNSFLKNIWEQHSMITFKDFLRCYNNKDVVPTLEVMLKMIEFYHDKEIDMLKLGCTLPKLANICLRKSTNHKLYPFFERDKDLCEKIREDMRKSVVDLTYFRNSSNICKAIVGIDASQLYPFSIVKRC